MFDCEFNFLPGVLESLVDIRVVQRSPSGADTAGESIGAVVESIGAAMNWVPLKSSSGVGSSLDESFAKATASDYIANNVESMRRGKRSVGPEDAEIYQVTSHTLAPYHVSSRGACLCAQN